MQNGNEKRKKREKEEGVGSIRIFQLVAQFAYKRIAIVIKARSPLPCEVIATISLDAFSAPVINVYGSNEGRNAEETRLKSAVKMSRKKSQAKVYRDSIKRAIEKFDVFLQQKWRYLSFFYSLFYAIEFLNAIEKQNDLTCKLYKMLQLCNILVI